jgi:site-specific DNA-methyltransferase (cytosine-N4-specific)
MTAPYYSDESVTLYHGDALNVARTLDDGSADCIVTSPPYFGLRDYGVEGQYGLEASPTEYVETMRSLFSELRRVLADDGTLWLNIGDSYSSKTKGSGGTGRSTLGIASGGHAISAAGILRSQRRQQMDSRAFHADVPEKNMLGIPWRLAFALQDDGWILRNAIIWHKPNAMPESVMDRVSCDYETVFMLSKSRRYWFDLDPIREPLAFPDAADGTRVFGGANKAALLDTGSSARRTGNRYGLARPGANREQGDDHDAADPRGRNPGSVWTIATQPFAEAHFAVMPTTLAERCILAGCKPGGVVLDPFSGSGTTGLAATKHGRRYVGIDLNREYLDLSLRTRLAQTALIDGAAS